VLNFLFRKTSLSEMPVVGLIFNSVHVNIHYQDSTMKILALITAIIAVLALVLFLAQDKLILFPTADDPDMQSIVAGAMPWTDGGVYRGLVFEPDEAARGTILFYHGNAGTARHREPYARVLTRLRYRVVLQEYPGFSARPGSATVRGALASALEDAALASRTWTGPIYAMGESFGAGMAAQVAGSHRDKLDGVVLFTPWSSLASLANEQFSIPLSFMLHKSLDSAEALRNYPGNVVIIGAERDTLIPIAHAKALARSLPRATYIELPGAGHNDWFAAMNKEVWEEVLNAMALKE
jgi:pimeloyl-ACP methyl ester carboxylesterase